MPDNHGFGTRSKLLSSRTPWKEYSTFSAATRDVQGAKLRNVVFRGCDLRGARFPGTLINTLDLRGSHLAGIDVDPNSLRGALIDPTQVADIADVFGLLVEPVDENEDA